MVLVAKYQLFLTNKFWLLLNPTCFVFPSKMAAADARRGVRGDFCTVRRAVGCDCRCSSSLPVGAVVDSNPRPFAWSLSPRVLLLILVFFRASSDSRDVRRRAFRWGARARARARGARQPMAGQLGLVVGDSSPVTNPVAC